MSPAKIARQVRMNFRFSMGILSLKCIGQRKTPEDFFGRSMTKCAFGARAEGLFYHPDCTVGTGIPPVHAP